MAQRRAEVAQEVQRLPGVAQLAQHTPVVAQPAQRPPGVSQLAQDPAWLALGHWRPGWVAGWESDVEPGAFFIHPQGLSSPDAELAATAAAMATGAKVGPKQLPAPCAFPARAAFLLRHGLPVAAVACPDFAAFKEKLAVRSVTLVFASAYANNPASMFGHVSLRLNHAKDGPSASVQGREVAATQLLNNSVAFLAQLDGSDDPLSYTYKGLTGGYPGQFMVDPYYVTVAFYTDGESRDLWEYDLNLSEAETEVLVAHLWEVTTQARFRYFFARSNCAYQQLTLLNVARPEAGLIDHVPAIVLPLEVARSLHARLGRDADARLRPSLKRQLRAKIAALTLSEAERLQRLRAAPSEIADEASAPVLDGLITYLNYRKFATHNQMAADERRHLRAALVQRSRLALGTDAASPLAAQTAPLTAPAVSAAEHREAQLHGLAAHDAGHPLPQLNAPAAPDTGHPPAQLLLGGGGRDRAGFTSLRLKAGLHDLLRDDRGYESFAAINYLDLALRYYNAKKQLSLDRLTVVEVTALTPFDWMTKTFSWRLGLHLERLAERGNGGDGEQHQVRGDAGGGLSWALFSDHLLFYDLLLATAAASPVFHGHWRLGPGLAAGVVLHLGCYRLLAEGVARRDLLHGEDTRQLTLGQAVALSNSWDLRAEWLWAQEPALRMVHREGSLAVGYSF